MAAEHQEVAADQVASNRLPEILETGFLVDGKYRIISFLGKGGMCNVYKAEHLSLGHTLSLKIPRRSLMADSDSLKRFLREVKALAALNHPNIARIFGCGRINEEVPYMAMEYLQGESLATLLTKRERLPQTEALPIFLQILDGLEHAHQHGIVHRDIKPSNVMIVGPQKEVKLIDFGIAKILPESGQSFQRLTQTGQLFGTVGYMSPEQCLAQPLDVRSDIYSMGCLMYEALDGKPPFLADTAYATISKHLNDTPPPSKFLSDDLAHVVAAALEKDPERRPQSAIELKSALSNPASCKPMRHRYKMHNPTNAIVCGAIGLISAAFAVGGITNRSQTGRSHFITRPPEESRLLDHLETSVQAAHPNEANTIDCFFQLGEYYSRQHRYSEAITNYQLALAREEKLSNPDDSILLKIESPLFADYCNSNRHKEAVSLWKHAIDFRESRGKRDEKLAALYHNWAEAMHAQDQYTDAQRAFKTALSLAKGNGKADDSTRATILLDLGSNYFSLGQSKTAAALIQQAMKIWERLEGSNSTIVALARCRLADCYLAQGKYDRAEANYRQATAVYEKLLGPDAPQLINPLVQLAMVIRLQDPSAQVIPLLQRALRIEDHQPIGPSASATALVLAQEFLRQQEYSAAENVLRRFTSLTDKTAAVDRSVLASAWSCYADLLAKTNRQTEAQEYQRRAKAIQEALARRRAAS